MRRGGGTSPGQTGEAERLRRYRSCLTRFPTGVAVVSFAGPDGPRGLTVNSFTSVSLDPCLVLVCIARKARAHDALKGQPFCVNVLGAEQTDLAFHFAGAATCARITWEEGTVAPRLAGCLVQLECRPWRCYAGGDHSLFLGEVVDFTLREGDPLASLPSGLIPLYQPILGVEYLL